MPDETQVGLSTANSCNRSYLRRISDGASVPVVLSNSMGQQEVSKGALYGSLMETHDSCYSSCSEESHSSLSREPSDSIAKEVSQRTMTDMESESTMPDSGIEQDVIRQNVDFATRLGYSVEQLETVLGKLGMSAREDQILDGLLKLGRGTMDQSLKVVKSQSSNTAPFTELRSIVIDGSNIAMTHGRKEVFSCRGILECVQFFRNRGHTDIIVFVPQFRREAARSDCPITDQHILFELEKENILVWTPSRRINGRRIVCHDDRYILKTAEEKNAVIVSNDEYRDLIKENPQYRILVDERLLMYSFVDGKFMPPDDPLGRHGPKLAQFLMKGQRPSQSQSQLCPYARRCTYGNKCKYYHPERPNGIHISVTDRLMKEKQRKQFFSTNPAQSTEIPHERMNYPSRLMWNSLKYLQKEDSHPLLPPSPPLPSQFSVSTIQQIMTPFPQNPRLPLEWTYQSRGRYCSALPNHSLKIVHPQPSLPITPVIRCNPLATNTTHYCDGSTAVPSVYLPYPYIGSPYLNGNNCCSDLRDGLPPQRFISNSGTLRDASGVQTITSSHLLPPSTTLSNDSKLSLKRSPSESTYSETINERHRLQDVLCQLFPKRTVLTVMEEFPNESDPQELCSRIIAELQRDHDNT
uniref:C3H1-type domain-containing protein n=1 Tax=Setaria digitata TaxID=48799 RepID=A0A915Q4T3_9BILA